MAARHDHSWILSQMLLVPMTEATALPGPRGHLRRASGTVGLPVFEENGLRSLPVFTGAAELARWAGERVGYVALDAVPLLEAFLRTPADRILVDAAGERTFALDRDDARALIDAADAVADEVSKEVIQPPPPALTPLLFVFRDALANHAEVREAYLYRSRELSDGTPIDGAPEDAWTLTLLFAFEAGTTDERREAIHRELAEAWRIAAAADSDVIQAPIDVRAAYGDSRWLRALSRTAAPVKP